MDIDERNARLQILPPVSVRWHETDPAENKWLSWVTASCALCGLSATGWTTLGTIHDPCGEEWVALNELEKKGCPHCEPARIVVDLLDLETPPSL